MKTFKRFVQIASAIWLTLLTANALVPSLYADTASAATDAITCITVGAGLKPAGQHCSDFALKVNLTPAGVSNGTTNRVARGDHNHFGQLWTGASSEAGLRSMNTGTGSGLYGSNTSTQGAGVYGYNDNTGKGVLGESYGYGVWGHTIGAAGAGVVAQGSSGDGTALRILNGGIKVDGAGNGTATPVFVHMVQANPGGNICAARNFGTVIDNPLTNGRSNAILLITPNYGAITGGVGPVESVYAVYYDNTGECGSGAGKWVIYNLDAEPLNNQQMFNVLVVNVGP